MNKIEYDDGYRFRKDHNFIESDQFNLHIKLRVDYFKHYYERSDFKSELLQNKISFFEFEEFLNIIENSVKHFSVIKVLLLIIYFSGFFFIIFVPIFCLLLAFCFDESYNIDPIFITLFTSVMFGFVFLIILRICYAKVLKSYEKKIKGIIMTENKEKFIKKNIFWSLGRNCLYLKANIIDSYFIYGNDFNYVPPNEYLALSYEEISDKENSNKNQSH